VCFGNPAIFNQNIHHTTVLPISAICNNLS
jgi:hypothetical protein